MILRTRRELGEFVDIEGELVGVGDHVLADTLKGLSLFFVS